MNHLIFFEHLLKRGKNTFMKTLGKLQVFLHPKKILSLLLIMGRGHFCGLPEEVMICVLFLSFLLTANIFLS